MATILVLEDDFAQRLQTAETFEEAGHQVHLALNGTEALALIEQHAFDVILVDIVIKQGGQPIPDGGLLFIGRLRMARDANKHPWLHDALIVAVSGAKRYPGMMHILDHAKTVGADLAVEKPLSASELLSLVAPRRPSHSKG